MIQHSQDVFILWTHEVENSHKEATEGREDYYYGKETKVWQDKNLPLAGWSKNTEYPKKNGET